MESKRISILVIDDNQDNLISLKALIREGFSEAVIFTALNGKMGMELAMAHDPDLVLLDIVMPLMDGFEVCQLLKADKKLRDIPVVFVTALKDDKSSRIRALECGAEAFLAKPIDETELIAQIRAMVKIKKANLEKRNRNHLLAELVAKKTIELKQKHLETVQLLEELKIENEARKKSEELLRESEWFFIESQKAANVGSYKTDFKKGIWQSSAVLDTIFGIEEGYSRTVPGWLGIIHPADREMMRDYLNNFVIAGHHSFNKDYRIIRKSDGEIRWVNGLGKVDLDQEGNVVSLTGTIQDITENKLAEKRFELSFKVLNTLNNSASLPDICKLIIQLIQQETGFDAVGIRLNEGEDYPFYMQNGFSEKFIRSENSLISFTKEGEICRDPEGHACLACTCGLVISGKVDSSSPLFTRAGSFFTNNSISLLQLAEDPRHKARNRCIQEGFLSFVIIPIRIDGLIVGSLQLHHRKENVFNEDRIHFFESLCEIIGLAIMRKRSEDRIRESEERYSKAFLTAPYAIGITGLDDGILIEVNNAYAKMSGYSRRELVGHSPLQLSIWVNPEDRTSVVKTLLEKEVVTGKIIRFRKKTGEIIVGYFSAALISLNNKKYILSSINDITEQEKNRKKLKITSEELRQLALHLITIREDERKLVAREIHDELGQGLTGLKFGVSWIKQHLHADKGKLEQRVDLLLKEVTETMGSFRRIYNSLYPALLDELGLFGALEWLINSVRKSTDLPIQFSSNMEAQSIAFDKSLIVYRVVQESLTNIMRYADAKTVSVNLNKINNFLFLEIEDDGCGFIITEVDTIQHHGLVGMRERVSAINGEFQIHSVIGKGTTVTVKIPVE